MDASPLLSPQQAAEFLGVSLVTVRRWFYAGRLPAVRLGVKLLKFKRADLEAFIASGESSTKTAAPSALSA